MRTFPPKLNSKKPQACCVPGISVSRLSASAFCLLAATEFNVQPGKMASPMRILLSWAFLLLGSLWCHSQTATVLDGDSGLPLDGVTLISDSPHVFAITNAKGQVDLAPFEQAEAIQIRSLGYATLATTYRELEALGFEIRLEPSDINLDEVVLSATRWRQSKVTIPSTIASVSPREVILHNPQTAADLLGLSGKVFIQKSQQGGGSPMIRGFATNRLIYTIDGVRMNTAIFRGGNLQNVINLDPFATESTEVLFGPGSVIYGSDAIGGVMSFQTLTPRLSLNDAPLITGKAVSRYATANKEKTGHFDLNVGWKKWALVTSLSSWDYDHLRQGSNGPDDYIKDYFVQRQDNADVVITQSDPLLQVPSGYSQVNLMQKVRYRPGEAWDFQYGFHYSETSPYGRYDRHNRLRNGLPRYAEWDYGPQKWLMNNFSLSHDAYSGVYDQLVLRLAHQAFEESRISRNLNNPTREVRTEKVQAYSVNLDFYKTASKKHKLYYGLEWVLDDVESTGKDQDISTGTSATGPSRYPQATWRSLAAYFSDEYQMSKEWTLQAGMRYNLFSLDADFSNNAAFYPFPFSQARISDGSLTGHLGAVYRPDPSWVLKGSLATAFRSPNVDDVGKVFDSEPGAVTVPNPDLKAEYAWNADVGMAKVFRDRLKLELSAYYTRLNKAMVRRDYQLGGQDSIVYDGTLSRVQAIQNAAVADVYGIQVGLEIKLPAGFGFSTDLNWQQGEEDLDDGTRSPSRHAAPFFGQSRLTYRADRLELQFYVPYQGRRRAEDLPVEERNKDEIYAKDSNGQNFAPSWYTLNLKGHYDLSKTFSLGAGLENLTDQRYRPYSSGLSGPGRNFILSLQVNF